MKSLLILSLMFFISEALAVCSTPISRTNYSANTVLTSTALNNDFNQILTQVNELPGDCIEAETITTTQIDDGTIANADISASAAIARSKLASVNYSASSSSGSLVSNVGSFTDVTNLSATITTTGGPVEIYLISASVATPSSVYVSSASGTAASVQLKLVRNSTDVAAVSLILNGATGAIGSYIPPSSIRFFDTPAAGTYTYKLQAKAITEYYGFTEVKLVAREL